MCVCVYLVVHASDGVWQMCVVFCIRCGNVLPMCSISIDVVFILSNLPVLQRHR